MKIIAVINICIFANSDHNVNLKRKLMYRTSPQEWKDYLALIPFGRDLKNTLGDLWDMIDFHLLSQQPHGYNRSNQDDRKEAEFNMRGVILQDPDIIILLGNDAIITFNEVTLTMPYFNTIFDIPEPLQQNIPLWRDDIRHQIEQKQLRNGKGI